MASTPHSTVPIAPDTGNLTLELRQSAEAVHAHLRSAGRSFLLAGRELRAAKDRTSHGEWQHFLAYLEIPDSTARALMRAAKAVDDGVVPEGRSLRVTLKDLADHRREKRQRVSVLDTTDGRSPDGPCATCDCHGGGTLREQIRRWAAGGPDPWECPERIRARWDTWPEQHRALRPWFPAWLGRRG